jgi:branched-chain amino acid transport system substrate-binding protein
LADPILRPTKEPSLLSSQVQQSPGHPPQKPDVVYFAGFYDKAAPFFKAARAHGIKSKFIWPNALDSPELAFLAGKSAVGAYYTAATPPTLHDPLTKTFAEDYKRVFAKLPASFSSYGYDAAGVVLKAIEDVVKRGDTPSLRIPSIVIAQSGRS